VDPSDPRQRVEAPVRRALASIAVRGVLVVVGVLAVILGPRIPALRLPGPTAHALADATAIGVTVVLLAYSLLVRLVRRIRSRIPDDALARAWHAAREIDPPDALLALAVAGWVPVAIGVALLLMTWPHLNDPDPALRGAWAVLGLPPIAVAWILATNAWLHACRESLARAEAESRRRFRGYWANPGS